MIGTCLDHPAVRREQFEREAGMALVREAGDREQERGVLLADVLVHPHGRLAGGLRHREHLALLDRRQLLAVAHERRLGEVELLGDRGQAQHVARGDHRAFVGDDDGVGERGLGRLEALAGLMLQPRRRY
jgi:hypothetical protein